MLKFLTSDIHKKFRSPLSEQAADQLTDLLNMIVARLLAAQPNVGWTYIWGSVVFTSKQAYKQLRGSLSASPLFKWMWKSSV